jgi:translation initiation factor 2 beta subunit (eIF-2beta)/eIF-5
MSGISRFLSCPECESDDVSWRVNNGRLVLSCEDCLETTSKLVGRATFR